MNIDAGALASGLRTVLPATKAGHLPVLKGVLLETTGDRLHLTATDLDMTITTEVEAGGASLTAVVPGALLAAWAEGVAGEVAIDIVDDGLRLASDTGTMVLRTLPIDDWPKCETANGEPVDLDIRIAGILYAASRDGARPILNGVGVGDGWACCTDSYRLAAMRVDGLPDAILPVRLVELALKSDPATATIAVDDRRATIVSGAATYTARLIEGRFPTWQPLVGEPTTMVTLDRERTVAALERVLILADAETPVRVSPDGDTLTFTVVSRDVGEIVERVAGGAELGATFGFRPRLLLDMLRSRDEAKVDVGLIDSLHPVSIRDDDRVALVMPVRLG